MQKIVIGIFFICLTQYCFAGDTDTINIWSTAMQKDIKCVVITPSGYSTSAKKYPVVYLLHGHGGSYAQWPKLAPQLKDEVDAFQFIIVCPDGGYGSWYFDSPVDTSFRYETFTSKELIKAIDNRYRTIADRNHRAITGLSMGGHGAFYLSIRHKELFGASGVISGGVDIRPFPTRWDLMKRLGDTIHNKENWEKNTVINIVDSLKNNDLKLIFDCGTEDFFLQVNRNLHQKLLAMKIEHDYIERPGGHNSTYWNNSIDYQLLFFKKFFESR